MQITAQSIEEFGVIAQALGFVPQQHAAMAAQQLAKQMLEQAGFTVTVDGQAVAPSAAPTEQTNPVSDNGSSAETQHGGSTPSAGALDEPKQEVIPPAKTTKSKKADKPEPLKADEPKPGEDILGTKLEASGAQPLTTADAVAAMRNLAAKKNVEVCRELLKKYDSPKASTVPADKIAAFVAEANQMAEAA